MGSVYVPPIGRQRLCAPHPPGWPIALGSTRVRDEPRESAQVVVGHTGPRSMVRDDRLGEPSAHSTTAETPWPRRSRAGPEAAKGRPRVIGHGSRPSRAAARSVLTCTPMSSASTGDGRSAWSSRCVASVRARASIFSGVARRPASHVRYTRETHRASRRTPAATGPARSGMHVAYGAPRRHTMPSAPAVVKRGVGAGRTSVSQSWKVTGHFFRLYLRPWYPGSGHNQRILYGKWRAPAGFEPATLGLRRPCV